jgi:outer membrane protein assembly factor BamA
MPLLTVIVALIVCLSFETTSVSGQSPLARQVMSRADEILSQRVAKKSALRPDEPGKLEQAFVQAQDVVEKLTASRSGLRLKFSSAAGGWEGLVLGSGFSLGPEFHRADLAGGEATFRASAIGSLKKNYLFDTQFTLPRLASDKVIVDALGRYKAERSIDYYGPGSDSDRAKRTNYGRETSEIGLDVGWRSTRHLQVGLATGSLWFNVGPGIATDVDSTEEVFDSVRTPGIHEQTNFWRAGVYARFDSRTKPYPPGRGTQFQISFDQNDDREHGTYSFALLQANIQQAFAFLNEKRVFTVGAKTAISYTDANDLVPFYLQQTLGGPDDLRGFRLFRFTDNNRLVLNAEYRWEVAPPIEMALFADGGKVFRQPGELNFSRLKAAGGFGVRIKTRSAVALRLDSAFSREGWQLWFRFADIF